ncbi:hypothetical protein SEA_TERMINUS_132 [Mycobacterium phage Terminus]|uniref:ParB-like nuclease domain protein n=2 Tax=Kostyavirus CJW1 TaxID=205869 RepID=A0A7D5JR47_9CAUD|nr:ParB C-terminal domain [Mycobacterium phage Contagion]YP_008857617.1 ParB C-terminal domain [Mycobacterium phage PhatBacter]YP_008858858.1 ParB C-terminal domain [Mycobacterium phage HufflyPuff]YP_008859561.1 ParB C-terminal domain [Mycobacterium phage Bruin]AHB32076.1 hypothetical protein PBI_MOSBY_126 [Mycobacterium phage Mosby]ATN91166.1 hypothetical protein SEA_MURICA_133 [Mycobacterium phage Murica]ATN91732.1 hypothetical protein SEA_SASSAY_124 [Mycobacterium phage Sassay]ATN92115.1 
MSDYRGTHTAPTNDGYGVSLDSLSDHTADVYARPRDHHGGDDTETMTAVARACGNPKARVTIYRAVPHGVTTINAGDWVSLSEDYAREHGDTEGMTVLRATVRASQVWWDGNSLYEYGYDGPDTEGQTA